MHGFFDDLAGDVEPTAELAVLEPVPELHECHQLAGHVAVLSPRADLVVVELRVRVPVRGRLRVLVDVTLPAVRGDRTERATRRR